MIFVTVGTQNKDFYRLLRVVENAKLKGIIKEDVIVQKGYTKFKSDVLKVYDFLKQEELDKYIEECSLLITHGGVGILTNALKQKKKIFAMPRLKEYKEHINDHQTEIIDKFVKLGYIKRINSFDDLQKEYLALNKFKPKYPKFDNSKMIDIVTNYIDGKEV